MYWEQTVQCEAATDVGLRRKNNEDSHSVHLCQNEEEWLRYGHLILVADGMGGHAVGELASRLAAETVPHTFLKSSPGDPRRMVKDAVIAANQTINERGTQNADFHHMGTTCSVLVLTAHGAIIGHVGDSRVYRVRRDRVDQLTFDHSLQWEIERQHGSAHGVVDLNIHKNIITRSLGPESQVEVDIEGPSPIFPGDTFVLCSDGLSNQLSDAEIGAIARELPPAQAVKMLIDLANLRGGPDNITALVVRVGDLPANIIPHPVDRPVDDVPETNWAWLGGIWASAFILACGIALCLVGQAAKGAILLGVAVLGIVVLTVVALRQRRPAPQFPPLDDPLTQHSRPHRTAVGLTSQELADLLIRISGELQRNAREDQWKVDWQEYDQRIASSQQMMREKRYTKAVRDLARAIHIVMSQLPRTTR